MVFEEVEVEVVVVFWKFGGSCGPINGFVGDDVTLRPVSSPSPPFESVLCFLTLLSVAALCPFVILLEVRGCDCDCDKPADVLNAASND